MGQRSGEFLWEVYAPPPKNHTQLTGMYGESSLSSIIIYHQDLRERRNVERPAKIRKKNAKEQSALARNPPQRAWLARSLDPKRVVRTTHATKN